MVLEIDSTTKAVTLKNEDGNKDEQKWILEKKDNEDGYVRFRNGDDFLTVKVNGALAAQEALHENCKYLFKTKTKQY